MRYVIVITACAFVLAWDLIYNRGDYIEQGVRMLNSRSNSTRDFTRRSVCATDFR